MLKEGEEAPEFVLPDQDGRMVALSDFLGRMVVLYFYPKDDTPGCTTEAVDFTKLKSEFEAENTVIVGISSDSCESHVRFIKKHALRVMLLADREAEVQKRYGVWRPKKFMGKEFLGTVRSTFLVDEKGRIAKIWDSVNPSGHAAEVLAEVRMR
jgi:peroxiredoxin Q/BCP